MINVFEAMSRPFLVKENLGFRLQNLEQFAFFIITLSSKEIRPFTVAHDFLELYLSKNEHDIR
jgi:hypothetical protein